MTNCTKVGFNAGPFSFTSINEGKLDLNWLSTSNYQMTEAKQRGPVLLERDNDWRMAKSISKRAISILGQIYENNITNSKV